MQVLWRSDQNCGLRVRLKLDDGNTKFCRSGPVKIVKNENFFFHPETFCASSLRCEEHFGAGFVEIGRKLRPQGPSKVG